MKFSNWWMRPAHAHVRNIKTCTCCVSRSCVKIVYVNVLQRVPCGPNCACVRACVRMGSETGDAEDGADNGDTWSHGQLHAHQSMSEGGGRPCALQAINVDVWNASRQVVQVDT